jgi:hypothetical protein
LLGGRPQGLVGVGNRAGAQAAADDGNDLIQLGLNFSKLTRGKIPDEIGESLSPSWANCVNQRPFR